MEELGRPSPCGMLVLQVQTSAFCFHQQCVLRLASRETVKASGLKMATGITRCGPCFFSDVTCCFWGAHQPFLKQHACHCPWIFQLLFCTHQISVCSSGLYSPLPLSSPQYHWAYSWGLQKLLAGCIDVKLPAPKFNYICLELSEVSCLCRSLLGDFVMAVSLKWRMPSAP